MLRLLKAAGKKLPYPVFLRAFYALYRLRDVPRTEAQRRELHLPRVDEVDLAAYKKSDTLFILGSGPSVNRISAERWAGIARHDSVGFNFWLCHPFVPTFYMVESAPLEQGPEVCRVYRHIAAARAADYAHTPRLVMGLHKPGRHEIQEWPREFRDGFVAVTDLLPPARTFEEFRFLLHYLDRREAFAAQPGWHSLFKYASSVTALIAFGVKMGYRRLVLCGIDLGRQEYFYQDPELYPDYRAMEVVSRQAQHATMVRVSWRIPADQVILALKQEILTPRGVELWVESRSSALWPRVEEAPAEIFEFGIPADGDRSTAEGGCATKAGAESA